MDKVTHVFNSGTSRADIMGNKADKVDKMADKPSAAAASTTSKDKVAVSEQSLPAAPSGGSINIPKGKYDYV